MSDARRLKTFSKRIDGSHSGNRAHLWARILS
jgi:hypothetical protein